MKNWRSRCFRRFKGKGPLIAILESAATNFIVSPGVVLRFHYCSRKLLRDLWCLAEVKVEAGVEQRQITDQLDEPRASYFLPQCHLTHF